MNKYRPTSRDADDKTQMALHFGNIYLAATVSNRFLEEWSFADPLEPPQRASGGEITRWKISCISLQKRSRETKNQNEETCVTR